MRLVPPPHVFDVSEVVLLRKRVGYAATSLKAVGFLSALYVLAYLGHFVGVGIGLIFALLTPGCSALIANRLRSGNTRAVKLAAAWWLLFAGSLLLYAFPKSLRAGITGGRLVGAAILLVPLYFLARGLVAVSAYRSSQRNKKVGNDLTAFPWEEGLRIKRRPKSLTKRSMTAYFLLIISPLPLLFGLGGMLSGEVPIFEEEAERIGYGAGFLIFGLALLAWGARIYRRARRAAMAPGRALVKRDDRSIVLYLRSFQDDSGIMVSARATNGRILAERFVKISFEELVTDHLWGYGPVVGIGDPRLQHKPAPLGAARDYAGDSSWQGDVMGMMREAAIIVAILGGTQGLAWEIDTIANLGLAPKLVLLFPPVELQELKARWQFLLSHTRSGLLDLEIDFARTFAILFPNGNAAVIAGPRRNN